MNSQYDLNTQVYALLEDLSSFGMKSSPRGHSVVEANVATLDIDPLRPLMDFADRKFNYKYFAGELAWYISKDNSIDFINNFSTFWSGVSNSLNAPVVKNLETKFVLYKSKDSLISFIEVIYVSKDLVIISIFHAPYNGQEIFVFCIK